MFCQTGTDLNGIISPKWKMWVLMRARPWRTHGSDMLAHGSIGPQDQQADHFLFYKWASPFVSFKLFNKKNLVFTLLW